MYIVLMYFTCGIWGQLICQHLANTNNTTNMYRYLSNVQVLAIQLLNCQHLYKFFSCQNFILCEHLQCKINFFEDCLKCETLQGLPVHIWSESNLVIFEILEVLNTVLSSSESALSESTMGCAEINNVLAFVYQIQILFTKQQLEIFGVVGQTLACHPCVIIV